MKVVALGLMAAQLHLNAVLQLALAYLGSTDCAKP